MGILGLSLLEATSLPSSFSSSESEPELLLPLDELPDEESELDESESDTSVFNFCGRISFRLIVMRSKF